MCEAACHWRLLRCLTRLLTGAPGWGSSAPWTGLPSHSRRGGKSGSPVLRLLCSGGCSHLPEVRAGACYGYQGQVGGADRLLAGCVCPAPAIPCEAMLGPSCRNQAAEQSRATIKGACGTGLLVCRALQRVPGLRSAQLFRAEQQANLRARQWQCLQAESRSV